MRDGEFAFCMKLGPQKLAGPNDFKCVIATVRATFELTLPTVDVYEPSESLSAFFATHAVVLLRCSSSKELRFMPMYLNALL